MKVSRIYTDVNHYQYFLGEKDEDEIALLTDGTSRKDSWSPPSVYIYKDKLIPGNFLGFHGDSLILNPQATKVLSSFLSEAGELLPLPYKGEVYTLLNVTQCISCLDAEETEWSTMSNGLRLYPRKYVFNPKLFAKSRIFKIPETRGAEVLVVDLEKGDEEELLDCISKNNLKGLIFEELWHD
ncbi:hypothetical protein F8S13_21430 [Chloroflexia bacterium SDU3-3]|nr:hypothetical protein F8S13_21430 [Chloroflexia bacterium SDU3-3]